MTKISQGSPHQNHQTDSDSALLRPAQFFSRWLFRWYGIVLAFSFLGAAIGAYYSVHLYKNLRTDMEELLPESAESVQDLKRVMGRVGGLNHLSVVIESQNVDAGRRFRAAVVERLRALPPTMVATVRDNIQKEKAFFEANKALYIELADWLDIEHYVRARIRWEKKHKNPFSLGLDDDEEDSKNKKPEYDFAALKKKYEERASQAARFENGFFESPDGKTHIVLAFLPGKVTDMSTNVALSEAAHKIVAELNPRSFAPDMSVGFAGDVQNLVEEHHGLVEDLILSSVIVMVLVGLVLWLYFRSFTSMWALLTALFAGTFWTFGLSYALVGYLNANTAFLGSIVIGNGINFGIISLARYLEERRNGFTAHDAIPRSLAFTAEATWTAACAAGLAYGSLIITDFRGFNQFGVIGGLGMLLCWISSFVTLPAILIWLEKRGWVKVKPGVERRPMARAVSRFVVRAHIPLMTFGVVATVLAVFFMFKLGDKTLESDFSKIRNKRSMMFGAGMWDKKVDAVFQRYLTPTIVLAREPGDAEKVAEQLREQKRRDGANSPISEISTVNDFLPKDQPRKIRVIADIKKLLPKQVMERLSSEDRKLVEELLPQKELTPVRLEDLPEGVVFHYRELNGTLGNMVHVYPILAGSESAKKMGSDHSFWDGREVVRFAHQIRNAIRDAGVPASIAGQPPLSADMIASIASDGPKATAFALIAVALLVVLIFRSWDVSKSVIGALIVGVVWMAGVMGAFDLKVNFLNFIALPITFGIGVDYAVNIFSRYKLEGSKHIARVVENTGGAVALCSATTVIGYSSLLIAGSQAFVSFGTLAVLGELTCVVVATIVYPALWHFIEIRQHRRRGSASADAGISAGVG